MEGYETKGTGKQGGKCYDDGSLLKKVHFKRGKDEIIELIISQHIVNYGKRQCNGLDGSDILGGGGGSGGSILIKVVSENFSLLKHTPGIIQCLGGNKNTSWREGGMGRIAIYGFNIESKDLESISPVPYNKQFIVR
ncbi:hypothetical protein RFI_10878 [Reticulomyxa filosa]|uniref:Obg domain-containing protein n=1 Tax=Reticulomyxa filosa TaxID=46433 RepID=X6NKJ2_RETFI|nr:hypothetical protein RFI_10878 [Reticulomyxa filosa]|eukprot:ETO26259.1 hypothetical protein RFI_10878 [Reticulomyxa filosa]